MTALHGKTILVTGGTSGLGKITAHALAEMGATVVIVGRNAQKTAQVVAEIRAATNNANVDSLIADLASQQSIHALAAEFKRKYTHLHVLLNNAGAIYETRQLSVDGIEMTWALNHMAYFLLTNLLLDTLKASAPARIVNVASGVYALSKLDFANLQGEVSYSQFRAYGNSKLANILFTKELARQLASTGVTVNALNPGFVNTEMQHKNERSLFGRVNAMIANVFAQTPEQGAQTSIYLASSPEVAGVTGGYFSRKKLTPTSGQTNDAHIARQLWDASEALQVELAGI